MMETQLYSFHQETGKITDFAGFKMPLWYTGVIDEVAAVRNHVGIFDVSHMGRLFIKGKDAASFLDYLTTNNVLKLKPLQSHYTVLCNDKGGIIDDLVLTRLEEEKFIMVPNANNRKKDVLWLKSNISNFRVSIEEVSDQVAMIAVQGPDSRKVIQNLCKEDIAEISRFGCKFITIKGIDCIATGTGYTGEDGLEIFVLDATIEKPGKAIQVWDALLAEGKEFNIKPCGLGSRDVLRLEAGMCLYGNDIDEKTTPKEARISFVVKLDDKKDFIGRTTIEKQSLEGIKKVRIGLTLKGKGIPRTNYKLKKDGITIGRVTSGTFSPTLKKGIAMGYVQPEYSKKGELVQIDIRDKSVEAEVVRFPFYDANIYGWQRGISKK